MTDRTWKCDDCATELSSETVHFFTDSDIPLCAECYSRPADIEAPRIIYKRKPRVPLRTVLATWAFV